MHVTRRLRLNAFFSSMAALAITLTLVTGLYSIHSAFQQLDLADEILNSLYQRNTLRVDYLMTDSQRAKEQWFTAHAQLGGILGTASEKFTDAQDREVIDRLIVDHEASWTLFSRIVENRQRAGRGETRADVSQAIEERLLTQVNIRLYDKSLNISQLREAARGRVFSELKRTGGGTAAFIVIVAALTSLSAWAMGRTISARISRLQEGASTIGEGNLEHRIDMKGGDEFAGLSRAFNAMTEKLSDSYLLLRKEVAERKRAEAVLRESEKSLKDALDAAELGTWEYDAVSSVAHFDERSRKMFGLREDRPLTAEEVFALIHEEDRPQVREAVNAALGPEGRGSYQAEYRVLGPDGALTWVLVRGHAVSDNEGLSRELARFRGSLMDLTDRKQAEEALREAHDELELRVRERTAELERRNQELQNFTYAASHDLQEPLRKIQTFSDLMRSRCADSFSGQEKDYLGRMHETATRMREVLNSLLTYSRLTAPRVEPFGRVDLNAIAREVVSDLGGKIEDSGASVEVGVLPELDADQGQMRQLLRNLLDIALKFRREGEKPEIRVRSDGGSAPQNGECIRVYVEDNGIGFEERYLDLIFKPFQRLHAKEKYGGVGMGLAICAKVVEHHRGRITARSTPGRGSTFIVTLPGRQRRDEYRGTHTKNVLCTSPKLP